MRLFLLACLRLMVRERDTGKMEHLYHIVIEETFMIKVAARGIYNMENILCLELKRKFSI